MNRYKYVHLRGEFRLMKPRVRTVSYSFLLSLNLIWLIAALAGCGTVSSKGPVPPAAASIGSLSPTSGAVGTSITISGTNFGATQGTSTVKFNGTAGTPTGWSATSITVPVPTGATTGNVIVMVAGVPSNGVNFTVSAATAPNITSLNPTAGAVGTSVTITGTNFGATQGTSTVSFNGIAGTPASWSATSITVPVPTGATTGNVIVTVAGVPSNGVNFTVSAATTPNITSLGPTSGAIGTPVTITGTNFGATQGTSTVKFNGTTGTPTSWSATSIIVPVPAGATTGNVIATVAGVASNGMNFTVTAGPAITVAVSPQRAGLTITQELSVMATTNDVAGVTWTASGGSFSSGTSLTGTAVTYTAPSSAGSYTITATSVSDNTKSSSSNIYVTNLSGVTTYHNDLARDGANTQEYALTTPNVNTATFGKLSSCPVDGAVYAQPLWIANVTVNGAKHNVVFVATQHDSLYAFDADSNPCVQLWHSNLIDSAHGGLSGETTVPSGVPGYLVGKGYGDISPEVGVTGTPVIDPSSNTLYVVSKSVEAGTKFFQRLHAIDLTTGNEKFTGPANLSSSNITFPGSGDGGSTVSFNPQTQNQRAGLALVNGVVYVAWASHEDTSPFYGWVVGFNASNLAITNILNVSPNTQDSGIWMGGGAPSADANNNIYLITGNGVFNAATGGKDYGDSFLQLSGKLAVTSYFSPTDQESGEPGNDNDFGAGGAAVVLNLTSGTVKHLVVGGGKDGTLYLVNGDSMGGQGDANARQHFNISKAIYATGAFWNNNFYIAGVSGPLVSYTFNSSTNLFNTGIASQSSSSFGFPGASPSVSSFGTSDGIVWALDNRNYCTAQSPGCGPTVLHAYDATNLATELWNSSMVSTDAAGDAVKFTVPTIANGKVYVGTRSELSVYGLLNGTIQAAAPTFSPGSESFTSSVQVTITENTSGASVYYTTDGTTPTTASKLYTAPFTLTATSKVTAIAAGAGLLASPQASATYTLVNPTVTPSPTTLAFGNQQVSVKSSPQTVTLTNNYNAAVAISSIAISGPNAADFAQSATTCSSSLAANATCTISLTFTPTLLAAETATLTITDAATNSPQTVSLTGTGVNPSGGGSPNTIVYWSAGSNGTTPTPTNLAAGTFGNLGQSSSDWFLDGNHVTYSNSGNPAYSFQNPFSILGTTYTKTGTYTLQYTTNSASPGGSVIVKVPPQTSYSVGYAVEWNIPDTDTYDNRYSLSSVGTVGGTDYIDAQLVTQGTSMCMELEVNGGGDSGCITVHANTVYFLTMQYNNNGTHQMTLYNSSGTSLGTITHADQGGTYPATLVTTGVTGAERETTGYNIWFGPVIINSNATYPLGP